MSYTGPESRQRLFENHSAFDSVNYVSNGTAAEGTKGWAVYNDGAGVAPVDGVGGTPTITLSRNTTSALRQGADFLITKPAANVQGQGISIDFTVDPADIGTELTISFDVLSVVAQPTSDLAISLVRPYVLTPSIGAVTPVPVYNQGISSTFLYINSIPIYSRHFARFFTGHAFNRLCFHFAGTSATAFQFKIDNVFVGRTILNRKLDFLNLEALNCRNINLDNGSNLGSTKIQFYDTDDGDAQIIYSGYNADSGLTPYEMRIYAKNSLVLESPTKLLSNIIVEGPSEFKAGALVTANSTGDALRVTQTGTGAAIRVEDSANPDATPFIVDTNGNVGIGTATPAQKLSVTGVIESTTGGIKFPDGTTQTTAAGTTNVASVITANSTTPALRITQTGTGDALLVEDSANPDATPFRVDQNGNLYVGANIEANGFITANSAIASNKSDATGFHDITINPFTGGAAIKLTSGTFTATPSFRQIGFLDDFGGAEASITHVDDGTFTVSTSTGNIILSPNNGVCGIGTLSPHSTLHFGGTFAAPIVSTTSASFAILNHYTVGLAATTGTQTATLPSAVGIAGRIYTVKRRANGATSYTVATTSSQTIDGATTYALTALNSFVTVQSDGANWWVIGKG